MKLKQENGRNKKICQCCHRIFWPKTDSDTCLLCQNVLLSNNPCLPQKSAEQDEKTKKSKKKDKRVCLRCQKEFDSDGIYNRICKNCRATNANISILAEPIKSGEISNSSD